MEKLNSSKFTILKRKYFRNSRIYTALYRENNRIYKVKVVPKIRAKELQILQKDLPPSCVKLLDHFKINKEDIQKESALVFPYYPSRISSVLSHVEELIPLETFQKWIKQIANTVNQLHKLGIIHADINPSNILLTEKKRNFEQADCVICDFGISSINSMKYSLQKAGTPSYIEPQVQLGDDPTTDSDVYSIGILMLSIVLKNRFNEFMMNPANKSLQAIKQKINEINFAPGKNNELAQLISKSICYLRAERIKLDEFLNHSFFDGTSHEPYPCSLEVDPQVALQGEFKEIKKEYKKFFWILNTKNNGVISSTLQKASMYYSLIKHCAKKAAVLQLKELREKCQSKLSKKHPLIQSITEKIEQYDFNVDTQEFLDLSSFNISINQIQTFADLLKTNENIHQYEMFFFEKLENKHDCIIEIISRYIR